MAIPPERLSQIDPRATEVFSNGHSQLNLRLAGCDCRVNFPQVKLFPPHPDNRPSLTQRTQIISFLDTQSSQEYAFADNAGHTLAQSIIENHWPTLLNYLYSPDPDASATNSPIYMMPEILLDPNTPPNESLRADLLGLNHYGQPIFVEVGPKNSNKSSQLRRYYQTTKSVFTELEILTHPDQVGRFFQGLIVTYQFRESSLDRKLSAILTFSRQQLH